MSARRGAALRGAIGALATTALLGACSQHTDDPTGPGGGEIAAEVVLGATTFTPRSVTVPRGSAVRFRNSTGIHTVTPQGHSQWVEWVTTTVGQTFDVTFNTAGTYAYYCDPHRSLGMDGTVVVQ